MLPALGVSCSRISLAVVVLPQPDSPMTPSVSPGSTVKSTPSTALTQRTLRRRGKTPPALGKYLARCSASSSGGMPGPSLLNLQGGAPASRGAAGGEPHLFGFGCGALRHDFAAARMKGTARRQ